MADQASPEQTDNADTRAAGAESNPGAGNPALELPNRLRVHALAKLLGVTSKEVLAELSVLGEQVRTAQSSVDRAVAERVHAAFAERSGGAPAAPAAPAPSPVTAAPAAEAPAAAPPAAEASAEPTTSAEPTASEESAGEPEGAVAAADLPLFLPPEPVATPRRSAAPKTSNDKNDKNDEEAATAETAPAAGDTHEGDEAGDDTTPRRRRRGRRGRGRGRGEGGGEQSSDDNEKDAGEQQKAEQPEQAVKAESGEAAPKGAEAEKGATEKQAAQKPQKTEAPGEATADADKTADDSDENDESGEGTSRRRRRRRRRRSGSGESADETKTSGEDPPNTVVHEREPRSKSRSRDEVQGITGSTRLEAKRQRRRDGRDAGRRRPPILSESEFLARREAVDRVMVVREKADTVGVDGHRTPGPITQVGVLEDGVLVEHFVTTAASASMVGNIYLGRVQNVLPSMEAAFIDIGRGRNGVLYAGEVDWEAAGLGGNSRKIEQALKPGDQVLVQVSKDPVGHKGARLTTQVSLAGRFLVYVPGGGSTGISRKLPDTERKRLKEILREIVPSDAGVIIRTASEGVSADELSRDVARLQNQWESISTAADEAKAAKSGAPKALYEEPDLLVKVVRDLFNEDFSKLVVQGDHAWETIESYIQNVAPEMLERVSRHTDAIDVFTVHRIDEQLAKALDRKVWLPSGGTLVIDRTEAMTVVDVNTGKFTGSGGNLEETVTRNNLEAAEEIVRQMRLRDIGGMIVVDFIDMVLESNRDLVLRRLTEALGRDRTRHQVSEVTSLGLVQMTRKRLGTGLVEAFSTVCEHCHGRGLVVHPDPVVAESSDGSKAGKGESGSRKSKRARKSGRSDSDHRDDVEKTADGDSGGDESEDKPKRVPAHVSGEHPMFRAMAASHEHDGEDAENPAGENEPAAMAAEPATAPAAKAPAEPAEHVAESAAPAPRRRSRRASRPAAAPTHQDVPEPAVLAPTAPDPVVTEDTDQQPAGAAAADQQPAAVAEVRRRPRRRAAGRQAGPPVHAEA